MPRGSGFGANLSLSTVAPFPPRHAPHDSAGHRGRVRAVDPRAGTTGVAPGAAGLNGRPKRRARAPSWRNRLHTVMHIVRRSGRLSSLKVWTRTSGRSMSKRPAPSPPSSMSACTLTGAPLRQRAASASAVTGDPGQRERVEDEPLELATSRGLRRGGSGDRISVGGPLGGARHRGSERAGGHLRRGGGGVVVGGKRRTSHEAQHARGRRGRRGGALHCWATSRWARPAARQENWQRGRRRRRRERRGAYLLDVRGRFTAI